MSLGSFSRDADGLKDLAAVEAVPAEDRESEENDEGAREEHPQPTQAAANRKVISEQSGQRSRYTEESDGGGNDDVEGEGSSVSYDEQLGLPYVGPSSSGPSSHKAPPKVRSQNPPLELCCQVCRGVYVDPRTLFCTHTFCKKCVESLAIDSGVGSGEGAQAGEASGGSGVEGTDKDRQFRCAICQAEFAEELFRCVPACLQR